MFLVAVFVAAVYNVAAGWYAVRSVDEPGSRWRRSPGFRWGLLAGAAALTIFAMRATFEGSSGYTLAFAGIPSMAFLGFTWVPFVVAGVGTSYRRLRRLMLSEHKIQVTKTYDQAESAERHRDWDRAIALYTKELAADPTDREAKRRLAELLHGRGRTDRAITLLREVALEVADPEQRATLVFRIADLMIAIGDRDGARWLLDDLARELSGTRFATFARDRERRLMGSVTAAR